MANNIAFQPMGKMFKCNATTNSQTISITSDSPVQQYMLISHEPTGGAGQPVYVRISTASNVTITVPSNGSAQYGVVVPPDTVMVITGPQCGPNTTVYCAFIAESGTPEVYLVPGEGL